MDRTLGAADIDQLLHELARRLAATGATAGIRVVGGAAIALMDSNRRATQDIDDVLLPAGPVQAIAGQIASELGLSVDWINDAARAYVPFCRARGLARALPRRRRDRVARLCTTVARDEAAGQPRSARYR